MKKKLIGLLIGCSLCSIFATGCNSDVKEMELETTQLQNKIDDLKQKKEELETEIVNKKIENGDEKYIVKINISQSHPWNLSETIKDAMNDIDIEIPVSKEFYDSVEVGMVLDDSFRVGSLIMNGSFGSWDVKISEKRIE